MSRCHNVTFLNKGDDDTPLDMPLSNVIYQVFLPAVCAFGIVGNLLNITILARRKSQKSFRILEQAANLCLISLAISDLFFCVFAFMTVFLSPDNIYDINGFWLFYDLYNVAIINVFIMESTMLTVAMSLERYLAICLPLRQDIYLTTRRIKFVIFFTVIFSIVFNIPALWRKQLITLTPSDSNVTFYNNITSLETDLNLDVNSQIAQIMDLDLDMLNATHNAVKFVNNASMISNGTHQRNNSSEFLLLYPSSSLYSEQHSSLTMYHQSSTSSQELSHLSTHSPSSSFSSIKTSSMITTNKTSYMAKIVLLGGSHFYDTSYRIIWAFIGNFIPLALLLYFNVCLCRQIYRSYKLRIHLGRRNLVKSSSHILTLTLVAIVVLFFILVAPSEITLQISHMTNSGDTPSYKNIEAVLNLMQSINFSVNFILYCIISPYFRKTLKHMVLCSFCRFYRSPRIITMKYETSFM